MFRLILLTAFLFLSLSFFSQVIRMDTYGIPDDTTRFGIGLFPGTALMDFTLYEGESSRRVWIITEQASPDDRLSTFADKVLANDPRPPGVSDTIPQPPDTIPPVGGNVFDYLVLEPQTTLPDAVEGMVILYDNGLSTELYQYINGQWYRYAFSYIPMN